LVTGRGKGVRFVDLFDASYVRRRRAAAVEQLQDAFEEISTLPRYVATNGDGSLQTIFPHKDILRLNQLDN
jgi:hypothetical protein